MTCTSHRHRSSFALGTHLLSTALALIPMASLAAPTLKIDGVDVPLTKVSCATLPYTTCWAIPGTASGRKIGSWIVKDMSPTNRARVFVFDVSPKGSIDIFKLSGITFTPAVPSGTKTTTVVMTNWFNASGGNPAGNYSWGLSMGGYFAPPRSENAVGNRVTLSAKGVFPPDPQAIDMGTLDSKTITGPTFPGLYASASRTLFPKLVKPGCDTGGGRCAPIVTQTFTITVVGADSFRLPDSVLGGGATSEVELDTPPADSEEALPSALTERIREHEEATLKSSTSAGAVAAEFSEQD